MMVVNVRSKLMSLFAAMILTWVHCTTSHAGLYIEINSGVDNPTPIAIVPFAGARALPEELQSIVSGDLVRSGFFKSIPVKDMLSLPSKQSEVHFRDWRLLGASFLVLGRMNVEQGAVGSDAIYTLEYELYDVLASRQILTGKTSGPLSGLRDMAHAVSDTVYEKITGIRGVFGTKIIYVEDMGRTMRDRYRLIHADADGARERVLIASSEPILSPAWSNKGDRIAYVSFETTRPAIYIMDLASGRKQQVTNFRGLNGAPAWSPDDQQLAMVLSKDGNPEIYVMDIATRKLRRVTRSLAIDTEPAWTPDGKAVMFTSNRGGSPQVYQVTLASGRPERLTFEGDYNARPQVTPDGKSVVMVHRERGVFHIASQEIKTGNMRILTETWLDESPSIAPNGAILLYATQHNSKGVLAAVSMDAGVKFRLPSKQGDVREPAWSPYLK